MEKEPTKEETLVKALNHFIDYLSDYQGNELDIVTATELMINLRSFMDPTMYEDNIIVMQKYYIENREQERIFDKR